MPIIPVNSNKPRCILHCASGKKSIPDTPGGETFFFVQSTRTQPEVTDRHRQSLLRAHPNTPKKRRLAAGGSIHPPFSSGSVGRAPFARCPTGSRNSTESREDVHSKRHDAEELQGAVKAARAIARNETSPAGLSRCADLENEPKTRRWHAVPSTMLHSAAWRIFDPPCRFRAQESGTRLFNGLRCSVSCSYDKGELRNPRTLLFFSVVMARFARARRGASCLRHRVCAPAG